MPATMRIFACVCIVGALVIVPMGLSSGRGCGCGTGNVSPKRCTDGGDDSMESEDGASVGMSGNGLSNNAPCWLRIC